MCTRLAPSRAPPSTTCPLRLWPRTLCRKHLETPPFGAITLDRLRPTDIEALVLKLKDRELSCSTVRLVYTVLRSGLDGAVRDGLITRNPAALVKRPGVERHEARQTLDADGVAALLRAAETSRYHSALVLIASTGVFSRAQSPCARVVL